MRRNGKRIGNPRRLNGAARDRIIRWVKREFTHCHLCGQPVNVGLGPGLPGSPEADEIIPVSMGGSALDRDNIRLAHRLCNQKRGKAPVNLARQRVVEERLVYDATGQVRVAERHATAQSRQW